MSECVGGWRGGGEWGVGGLEEEEKEEEEEEEEGC